MADYLMNCPEMTEATVVIVDDERGVRDSLESLISTADYRCVSFASGEMFLAEPLPHAPCCLLLDLQLGGQSGLAVQSELNARRALLPVLFLSGDASVSCAVSAMKAGAMDFLQKPFDPECLLSAVERALQVSAEGYHRRTSAEHDALLLAGLTRREYQILALLVDGNTNKTIARMVDISVRTVETHRKHIMDKLNARTLADVVRVWLDSGRATLPPGDPLR